MDLLSVCKEGADIKSFVRKTLRRRYSSAFHKCILFSGKIIATVEKIKAPVAIDDFVIAHPMDHKFGVVGGVLFVYSAKTGTVYRSTDGIDLAKDRKAYQFHVFPGGIATTDTNCMLWITTDAVDWICVGKYDETYFCEASLHNGIFFVAGGGKIYWYNLSTGSHFVDNLSGYFGFTKHRNELYIHGPTRILRWNEGTWDPVALFEDRIHDMVGTDHGIVLLLGFSADGMRIHILGTDDFSPVSKSKILVLEDGNVYNIDRGTIILHHKEWNLVDFEFYSSYRRKRTRTVLLSCRHHGICFRLFREMIGFV